ncbi:hypothetical protein DXG03_006805 [Asterophora parasitica]|uniref:Uncharacterized protein n=1 Tax=Asterophora parasitica TaxID=117018 RepID=A0A9P7G2G4_9AGAR|nr:hypothetical protein DXG03_006805 [Asterophora parasitica]
MRPLTLHASALNDAEYELYTLSLTDLAWDDDGEDGDQGGKPHDDAYYEGMQIGLREARGWLRGRYAHLVPPGGIDAILRFFSPDLSQTDTLTGGQFFAALRLVVHAENGQSIDRSLAFVQGHPSTYQPGSPQRPAVKQLAPPTPASIPRVSSTADAASSTPAPSTSPTKTNPFATQAQHAPHNPFVARPPSIDTPRGPGPPLPPRKPPPAPPPHSHQHAHGHGNSTSHPHPQSILIPPPKHSSLLLQSGRSSVSPTRGHGPPPPEKTKPTPLPKPSHVTSTLMKQSLQASKAGHAMKRAEVELEKERVLRVLKSSSSTNGTSTTKTTANERFDEGNGSEASSNEDLGARGRKKGPAPPLPMRRNTLTQQQPSPPPSVSSLEHVALAQATQSPRPPPPPLVPRTTLSHQSSMNPFPTEDKNPYHRSLPPSSDSPYRGYTSPQRSPTHRHGELPAPAPPSPTTTTHTASTSTSTRPPTHPDRKPPPFAWNQPSPFATRHEGGAGGAGMDGGSPTGRVFRSKSLHHPSPPHSPAAGWGLGVTPPPPPRRKRPESALVFGSSAPAAGGGSVFDDPPDKQGAELSRRITLSTGGHRRQSSLSLASTASFGSSKSTPEQLIGVTGESFSKIARTWQPRLEKARYKAEAGLSKRGYVSSPRSRSKGAGEQEELLDHGHGRWEATDNVFEPPSVDGLSLDGSVSGDEREQRRGKGGDREIIQGFGRERDEMKWPVQEAEGWRRL